MTETAGTDIGIETPPSPVMEKQDMLGLLDVKLSKV